MGGRASRVVSSVQPSRQAHPTPPSAAVQKMESESRQLADSPTMRHLQNAITSQDLAVDVRRADDALQFGFEHRFKNSALAREAIRAGRPGGVPEGRMSAAQLHDVLVAYVRGDPSVTAESVASRFGILPVRAETVLRQFSVFHLEHGKYEDPILAVDQARVRHQQQRSTSSTREEKDS